MTTKADLVERMLNLCPERDLRQLKFLTRELVDYRDNARMEKLRFEGTKLRGITGFNGGLLPEWQRVLVTGGTGCVGQVVLSHLVDDLPGAELSSVSRHPTPERQVAGVQYLRGDVRNPARMAEIMEQLRPDLVVHLAAQRNPAYAERNVGETVSTNLYGSQVVLDAAGRAGVDTVIVASTGKAVRLFTSDVYAATKKLVEYQAAAAAEKYGMKVTCTRFTHVVDNSIVGANLVRWIANDEPIILHSPHVLLPVQSALECYHLLMTAGAVAEESQARVVALRDLGWPPVTLLDLTLDYLAENPDSRSPILFSGYPAGYEAYAYPGTYDPLSAGDVSPLLNCVEAARTMPTRVLGDSVDHVELVDGRCERVDADLTAIFLACCDDQEILEPAMGSMLRSASTSLLRHLMDRSDPMLVTRIQRLGKSYDPNVADHQFIHEELAAFLAPMMMPS